MKIVSFETAKKLRETFNSSHIWSVDGCTYLYTNDDERKLVNWSSMEADYYLRDDSRFYPAPYYQEVIEFLEGYHKWSIYITPRFDGFDKAQIDTYYEIYKTGYAGGHDYSSDAHVGDRYESLDRAIQEVCDLILKEKNNK